MEIYKTKALRFLKIALLPLALVSSTTVNADQLTVVTTNSILASMAKEIAQDKIQISSLIGQDEEIHGYSPSALDLKKISSAKLFISNGLNLEGWVSKLGNKTKSIEASKGVKYIRVEDEIDPHAWNSPYNAPIYVDNIVYAICAEDPANCNKYKENADKYKKKIEQLANSYKEKFNSISEKKRTAITAHDAFGYLARDYNLKFIPIEGVNEESDISAKELASIVKTIKDTGIKVIFVENITNTKYADQLIKETNAVIGGQLLADTLSTEKNIDTYYKMLEYNLQTIYQALSTESN